MLQQSENILHRLFDRQIRRSPPNAHIHEARKLYENIVPSHTVYEVEWPDLSFRKFTNDGQYLICFGRSYQDLVVYRPRWLSFCTKGDACDQSHTFDLPPKSRLFDSYFSLLYTTSLATGSETICKDFFLSTDNGLYGIFATSTVPENANPTGDGAVPGVPSIDKITIYSVSLADGRIIDRRTFHDDFIQLSHNMGVFLYDDLLAVLSIRFQCIRIFQIRETGLFLDVRTIGTHCREDDELVLSSKAQEEKLYKKQQASFWKSRTSVPSAVGKAPEGSKGWPPLWNGVRGWGEQGSRRQRPAASTIGQWPVASGQAAGPGSGGEDRNNGTSGSAPPSTDLVTQYNSYFRGLLTSFEDRPTGAMDGPGEPSGRVGQETIRGVGSANWEQRNGRGGLLTADRVPQLSVGNDQTGAWDRSMYRLGPRNLMDLRTAYAPLGSRHDNLQGGRNSSTSGSGGQYTSSGLSRYGLSYTSLSGSSLERYLSGRGSSSVPYTSTTTNTTTNTTTSTDSSGCSEAGWRRNGSVSGGTGMGYRNGHVGSGGLAGAQPEGGNGVQYVVSSRVQESAAVQHEAVSGLPSGSSQQARERRPANRALSREDRQNVVVENGAVGRAHEHRWANGRDQPSSDDHTLPSRPVEEGPAVSVDRAAVQAEIAGRPPPFVAETANEIRGRRAQDLAQVSAREGGSLSAGQRGSRLTGDDGAGTGNEEQGGQMLGGIKQRLLSYIYRSVWFEDVSPLLRAQRLKRFYYHFQHYIDLVMWKIQFLDRYHLLIKFGSVDGVLQRNSDTSHQSAFLAVYNIETAEILGFYQNSSEEFLLSFEQFCDYFRVAPRYPLYMNFISSYSNNIHAREQLHKQKVVCGNGKGGPYAQLVKRTLAWVPFNSQCQSPSPYFDLSLFQYDEKLISAMDRHKPCMEHSIKFISRRRPNILKFKINPGPELGTNDGRTKRLASFIFHPIFPFAISVQQSLMQPPIVNLHFRK